MPSVHLCCRRYIILLCLIKASPTPLPQSVETRESRHLPLSVRFSPAPSCQETRLGPRARQRLPKYFSPSSSQDVCLVGGQFGPATDFNLHTSVTQVKCLRKNSVFYCDVNRFFSDPSRSVTGEAKKAQNRIHLHPRRESKRTYESEGINRQHSIIRIHSISVRVTPTNHSPERWRRLWRTIPISGIAAMARKRPSTTPGLASRKRYGKIQSRDSMESTI